LAGFPFEFTAPVFFENRSQPRAYLEDAGLLAGSQAMSCQQIFIRDGDNDPPLNAANQSIPLQAAARQIGRMPDGETKTPSGVDQ